MSYHTLEAWQEARLLTKEVYETTSRFPNAETFGLTAQLRRACVSVVSNIAEGSGRWWLKQQANFYYVSRGSLMELETQIIIANDLGYVDAQRADALLARCGKVGRQLNALITSTRKRANEPESATKD